MRTLLTRSALGLALLQLFLPGVAGADMRIYDEMAFRDATRESKVVVLDFHAKWCPICRAQSPELEKVLKPLPYETVAGFVVDYDKSKALRKKYDVEFQSTVVFLHGAKEYSRVTGVVRRQALQQSLDEALAKASQ